MDPFIYIISPNNRLPITTARAHDWSDLAEQGGFLLWNREGQVRRVSNAALRNVLNTYQSYAMLLSQGRISEVPDTMCGINWSETDAVDHPTSG